MFMHIHADKVNYSELEFCFCQIQQREHVKQKQNRLTEGMFVSLQ